MDCAVLLVEITCCFLIQKVGLQHETYEIHDMRNRNVRGREKHVMPPEPPGKLRTVFCDFSTESETVRWTEKRYVGCSNRILSCFESRHHQIF